MKPCTPAAEASAERAARRTSRKEANPLWKGGRFANPSGKGPNMDLIGGVGVASEMMKSKAQRRPPFTLPLVSPLDDWRRQPSTGLRSTWLGHSTVLLEVDGARILTDPVWSQRASPSQLVGPRRFHPPPVAIEALPPLHAILVSHDHYDHLDAEAVGRLAATQSCPFFTALGVGAHLERFGVPPERIVELEWWQDAEIPGTDVGITAAPAQHFSGRGPLDRNATLWASYAFIGPRHRVFFSGDTGLEPAFEEVARRLGPFDLTLLEIGAFHTAWGDIHLGPWQAQEALKALGGSPLLPVHWSTFDLAIHAWDEPIQVLAEAAGAGKLALIAPRIGEVRDLGDEAMARRQLDPWWRAAG
jgi:L-ascorbate metabolism protein UlaG (beta-lactamase superfamily)